MYDEFQDILVTQGARKAAQKLASWSRSTSMAAPDDAEVNGGSGGADDTEELLKTWDKSQFWDYIDAQLLELYTAAHNDHSSEQKRLEFIDESVFFCLCLTMLTFSTIAS
jgi:hypothetical protein